MVSHLSDGVLSTRTSQHPTTSTASDYQSACTSSSRTAGADTGTQATGTDLTEVFRGAEDLTLGCGYIFASAGDDEHWFLAAYWGLDVRVRLSSQRLYLRPYTQTRPQTTVSKFIPATGHTVF